MAETDLTGLYEGDVAREIRIRELELEALQAEVEAAKAQEWAAKMEVYWASYKVAVMIVTSTAFPPATIGKVAFMAAGSYLATDGLEWLLSD